MSLLSVLVFGKAVEALRAAFPDSELVQAMSKVALLRYVRARSTLQESTAILKKTIVRASMLPSLSPRLLTSGTLAVVRRNGEQRINLRGSA